MFRSQYHEFSNSKDPLFISIVVVRFYRALYLRLECFTLLARLFYLCTSIPGGLVLSLLRFPLNINIQLRYEFIYFRERRRLYRGVTTIVVRILRAR
jgi:hypothetical protein